MEVRYFHIEWFSKTDGPGNRTVLFLQGCNLRCPWCHSPHSRELESPILYNSLRCLNCNKCIQVCNQEVHFISDGIHTLNRSKCIRCGRCIEVCPTSKDNSNSGALSLPTRSIDSFELFNMLWPQLEVLKDSGGITISGGEALLQKEAVLEILRLCKAKGIHTAIETSLSLPIEYYKFVSEYVDCWLIGMRDAYLENKNNEEYKDILENIHYLSTVGKEIIVRFPVIKGYTESGIQLERLIGFMRLGDFRSIQVMPCNKNMEHYYNLAGIKLEISIEKALVDESEIGAITSFFKEQGFNVKLIT